MISGFSSISFNIFFILSSNSPLYFVPATADAISKEIIFLFLRVLGTIPLTIILASSSTIAVLPTPASPIKIGLFLHLLHNTSKSLLISSSRSITGSNSLFLALSVKLTPSSSINIFFPFLTLLFLIKPKEKSSYISDKLIFIPKNILIAIPSPLSNKAENKCIVVTLPSLFSLLSKTAFSITFLRRGVYKNKDDSRLPTPIILMISFLNLSYVKLYFFNLSDTTLSFFKMDNTKCSVPI